MTYDREHSKVGFWKTNCSELWERLRVSDSSPAPAPAPAPAPELTHTPFGPTTASSIGEFFAPHLSPASAPTGVPSYFIPGIFTKFPSLFSCEFEIEEFYLLKLCI